MGEVDENELKVIVEFLRNTSSKIDNGLNLNNTEEEDNLIDILCKYKDYDIDSIYKEFENKLNLAECRVINKFNEHIDSLNGIRTLIAGDNVSKKEFNRYLRKLFTSKPIDAIDFTIEYRAVLDYIQTDLKNKVLTERLTVLLKYHELNWLEWDMKNDASFRELINGAEPEKVKIDAIMEKAKSKMYGIRCIDNAINVHGVNEQDFLNKSNTAKSGFVDIIMRRPDSEGNISKVLDIVLCTADGALGFIQEREQTEKHTAAILSHIQFGDNELSINSIEFVALTEHIAPELSKKAITQEILTSSGINTERTNYLANSWIGFMKSHRIEESEKGKLSFKGYLCEGFTREQLNNPEEIIIKELQNISDNSTKINELLNNDKYQSHISNYFSNLGYVLNNAYEIIEINNHEKIIELLRDIGNKYDSDILISFRNQKIIKNYSIEVQKNAFSELSLEIANANNSFNEKQIKVRQEILDRREFYHKKIFRDKSVEQMKESIEYRLSGGSYLSDFLATTETLRDVNIKPSEFYGIVESEIRSKYKYGPQPVLIVRCLETAVEDNIDLSSVQGRDILISAFEIIAMREANFPEGHRRYKASCEYLKDFMENITNMDNPKRLANTSNVFPFGYKNYILVDQTERPYLDKFQQYFLKMQPEFEGYIKDNYDYYNKDFPKSVRLAEKISLEDSKVISDDSKLQVKSQALANTLRKTAKPSP